MSLFDTSVDWAIYDPATYNLPAIGVPNNGPAVVNSPGVYTGGSDWASWFDRIVSGAVAIRNAGQTDARVTGYPGTGVNAAMAGQPVAKSNLLPMLLIGGLVLAAVVLMKT